MENIIAVKCPKCGGDMELPVDALGGHVRCPYCNVRSSAEVVVRPLDGMGGADDAMRLNIVCTGQEYEEAIFNHLVQAGYNPKFGSRGFRYCRIANEPVAFPVTGFVRSET